MKRETLWVVVSCLMVTALLLAACAPGATKEKEVAPPAKEEVVGEEGAPGTLLGPFKVGETAQTNKLAVTVIELYLADSYEYRGVILEETITRPAGPGTKQLFAHMKIKNLDSALSYDLPHVGSSTSTLPIIIRGGYTGVERPHHTSTYYGADTLPRTGGKLPPGGEVEGKVLFGVPEGQTGYWVEYRLQIDPSIWARWLLE